MEKTHIHLAESACHISKIKLYAERKYDSLETRIKNVGTLDLTYKKLCAVKI